MTVRRGIRNPRSAVWGGVDQALSSGTNFLLLFVTVRSVDVRDYGAFSLVYLVYVLVLPLARATGTMPYTVANARRSIAAARADTRANLEYALSVGALVGIGCAVTAVVVGEPIRSPMLVLAVCFPLLLVQDAVRGVFFVRSEFLRATANDGVWAALMFAVIIPVQLSGERAPVTVYIAAWAGAGACAGVIGLVQLRSRIGLVRPGRWLRRNEALARPLFITMVFTVLPAQLTYLLMPVVSSLTALGEIRAAYVLFGILGVVNSTVAMIALPHASRMRPRRVPRFAAVLSISMAVLAVAWGLIVLLLPASIGRALIGPAWDTTGAVRLLLALSLVAESITVGPTTALSALRIPERLSRVRYFTAPLTLVLGLLLATWWGAAGVAVGFVVGYGATAVLSWLQVPRAAELPEQPPPEEHDGGDEHVVAEGSDDTR